MMDEFVTVQEITLQEKIKEYRGKARWTGSILGWSLALMAALTLAAGILLQVLLPLPDWFYGAGVTLFGYALVLPLVFLVMKLVPEVRVEKKRMRFRKFLLFLVLAQGLGFLMNLLGNGLNFFFAFLTGRDMAGMNPVNAMLGQMDVLNLLYICILGPVIEEYIFRWKLLNRLRPFGEKAAILYTSVMFGLMHGNLIQFLYATVMGIILGYMAVKTGRMIYNCLLHIIVNSYSALLFLVLFRGGALAVPVSLLSLGFMFTEIIAALILFGIFCGKTRLLPGDWPAGAGYRDFSSALYLNSGTIAFFLMSLLLMLYYLLVA